MMSKRLNTKYLDFLKEETLYLHFSLSQLIAHMPKGPVSTLLLFLTQNDIYPDSAPINFISLSDTINMLKYPPMNKRIDNGRHDDYYEIPTQTSARIGRIVKSILTKVDKSKFSCEYKGSATFDGSKTITFNVSKNGKSFAKFYDENPDLITLDSPSNDLRTFVQVTKGTKVIGSKIYDYDDETGRIYWDSEVDYFKIELTDEIDIKGTEDVTIKFDAVFSGKRIEDINDSHIEKFVNDITAFIKMNMSTENSVIEEVKGEDIRKWYNTDNYQSKTGQLGGSCMSYGSCQGYLDIYVENPDNVSLLILKSDNDKLIGRALLWKLDNGKRFVDRVYCHTDYDIKIFDKWAIDNDCIYRNSGNNNDISYYEKGVKIEPDSLEVTLDECRFDEYPYVDTLCYLDSDSCNLSNSPNQFDMELRDTEGKWSEWYNDNDNYDDDY